MGTTTRFPGRLSLEKFSFLSEERVEKSGKEGHWAVVGDIFVLFKVH